MKKFLVTVLSLTLLFTAGLALVKAQGVGETLVGEYTYFDPEGDLEYGSTYQWYRDGVAIPGATSIDYIITQEDIGTTLVFEVIPRSLTGISPGEPFRSEGVLISEPAAPSSGGVLPLPVPERVSTSTPVITYATSTATSTATTTPSLDEKVFISPIDGTEVVCKVNSKTFNQYLRINSKDNDSNQVKLWQAFLNKEVDAKLPITGYFGKLTFEAVKAFQSKYAQEVLIPWDIDSPTGYIYKSTLHKANTLLGCDGISTTLDNGAIINY